MNQSTFCSTIDVLEPPNPLLRDSAMSGAENFVWRNIFSPANAGSSSVMFALAGVKFSFMASAQNAASITPASESPCPVKAFVELICNFLLLPKTFSMPFASAISHWG